VNVSVGQKVSTKQTIGSVATDPTTGEAVLQFKIYKGDTKVDPETWLTK